MARGTAVGERVVSQAQTKAFDQGWDQMKHEDDGQRGRFVWDPKQGKMVRPDETVESRALSAPIMAGRFYENVGRLDVNEKGEVVTVDLGSRGKYNGYLKEKGLAHTSDYGLKEDGSIREGSHWDRKQQEKLEYVTRGGDHKERREQIGRALYEHEQKARNRRK